MMTFVDGVMVFIKPHGADAAKWKTWALNKYINLTRRANYPTVFTKDYIVPDGRVKIIRAVKEHAYIHIFAEAAAGMGYDFLASYRVHNPIYSTLNAYFDPQAAWDDPNYPTYLFAHTYDIAIAGRGVTYRKGTGKPKFDMVGTPTIDPELPWREVYDFPPEGDPGNPGYQGYRGLDPQFYRKPFLTELAWNNQNTHQYIHWTYPVANGSYGDEFIISPTGIFGGFRTNMAGYNSYYFCAQARFLRNDVVSNFSPSLGSGQGIKGPWNDLGPDIRAIFFDNESVGQGRAKYTNLSIMDLNPPGTTVDDPTARWWRRHAIQVVKSEVYGTRRFVIATDNKSRFYVYPLKNYASGPTLANDPILYADPAFPAWVSTSELDTNESWVWEFNKTATKAVTVAYRAFEHPDTNKSYIVDRFVTSYDFLVGRSNAKMIYYTTGVVEVNINITITGIADQDFTFTLESGRSLFPSSLTGSTAYLAASYALGNKQMQAIGFNEDDLITLQMDLYWERFNNVTFWSGLTQLHMHQIDFTPALTNDLDETMTKFLVDPLAPNSIWADYPTEFADMQTWGFIYYEGNARYTFCSKNYNLYDCFAYSYARSVYFNSVVPYDDMRPRNVAYKIKFASYGNGTSIIAEQNIAAQKGYYYQVTDASPGELNSQFGAPVDRFSSIIAPGYQERLPLQMNQWDGAALINSGYGEYYLHSVDLRSLSYVKLYTSQKEVTFTQGIYGSFETPLYYQTRQGLTADALSYEVQAFGKVIKREGSMPSANIATSGLDKIPWQFSYVIKDLSMAYFDPAIVACSVHPNGSFAICTERLGAYRYINPATITYWNTSIDPGGVYWIASGTYTPFWSGNIDIIQDKNGKMYTHKNIYNIAFRDSRDYDYYQSQNNDSYTLGRFATWGIWYQ